MEQERTGYPNWKEIKARMRYEYRMQVIGGEPVCGAGCIERFTPADNRGNRYDPRMEETRNSGRIESHPDIARLYEQYAHCFASMFVRQVRQCFSAVWADGFPRCRHRFPVM